MNIFNSPAFKQNMIQVSNWVDSVPVTDVISDLTYDSYEDGNPFRFMRFTEEDISNKPLRVVANTGTKIGAEVFSIFTNPYYIPHKIIKAPTYYGQIVDFYNKYSVNNENNQ